MADETPDIQKAQTLLAEAEKARKEKDYDRVIELCSACLDSLKDNTSQEANNLRADAHNGQGIAYSEKGEQDRAIQEYDKAISIKPNEAKYYSNRGVAYNEKGGQDRAIQDFDKAISINPDKADYYSNRGNAYSGKGEYDRAIQDHDKAISINPNKADYYSSRGVAYRKKGLHDRAIQDFDKAISINPDDADYYSNRGNALDDKGEYDRAIQNYDKAISIAPDSADYYSNRGNALSKKGEHDRAIQEYDKAISINPDDADYYFNRGVAYNKKGEYDRAIQDYDKAIELDKNYTPAYHNRALTLAQRDSKVSADIFRKEAEEKIKAQRSEIENQLKNQLKDAENQSAIVDAYRDREDELRRIIFWKRIALFLMALLTQIMLLGGFVYIVFFSFVPSCFSSCTSSFFFSFFSSCFSSCSPPILEGENAFRKSVSTYFVFVGYVASLYVLLSELRRMRFELRQYIAAAEDAFRKRNLAQYPILFLGDEEKRYQLARQFISHLAEKSPAEFILNWREKESRWGRRKKCRDCEGKARSSEDLHELAEKIAEILHKKGL